MANNLFITSTEARSGKSLISLGIMELLLRNIEKVAFFRPFVNIERSPDKQHTDLVLISSYFNLEIPYDKMYAFTTREADNLVALGKQEELIEGIINKYKALEKDYDFILCEGTDFEGSIASFEVDINAEVINNLGCPVLPVINAHMKTTGETMLAMEMAVASLTERGCDIASIIINRVKTEEKTRLRDLINRSHIKAKYQVDIIPYNRFLDSLTMGEIALAVNAQVLYGADQLNRHAYSFTVAAMQLHNMLARMQPDSLIITPGDRTDIIVACLAASSSMGMPDIAGILLTGGLQLDDSVCRLIEGFANILPILIVQDNTFQTARNVSNLHSRILPDDTGKITKALQVFEKNVAIDVLGKKIFQARASVITPKMFEYGLLQKAREHKQHIVLPEGEDERILRAAEILIRREIVDLTLLGDKQKIFQTISHAGLQLNSVNIIDLNSFPFFDDYVQTYYDLRKHKGLTKDIVRDIMSDPSFYGAMMVYKGAVDGMVSGAIHTTADTVLPAFRIIKTKPGCSLVSSVFFMCLQNRVLVYSDCAINPDPNAQELAEIAIGAARTALIFDIEPRVALLSYSTGKSGKGSDVDKVRKATQIAKQLAKKSFPGLKIEGPIQYDAAVDKDVARIKMPGSEVAGQATVLIFPDLNTGNNTYKAVQRSAKAVAIGPILQGLNKPVNDLSRGCLVPDIVNTIAITAIQAQAEKGLI